MMKRLSFAALALLVPAAVQAQGLDSLLSGMEAANEEKLNPVAEHPRSCSSFLGSGGPALQQASTICPALQKAVVAATGAESDVWASPWPIATAWSWPICMATSRVFQPPTKS